MSRFDDQFARRLESTLFRQMDDSITYTPKGGSGVSIKAILGEESVEERDGKAGLEQAHIRDAIILRDPASALGGVASPKNEDAVTIDSVIWDIEDISEMSPSAATLHLVRIPLKRGGKPD